MSTCLGLVLAGGGLAGIAWETGFLLGVQERAPDAVTRLLDADVLVGTSAGATVAAQVSSGVELTDLYARQLSQTSAEITPEIEFGELIQVFEMAAARLGASLAERLQMIGERAFAASTVSEEVRRSVIAQRLPSHDWPDRPLQVTAIDIDTGDRVVFDRDGGVPLVDAVAASCAVPGVWPPVMIGERRFMDGGVGSRANVDVAHGCAVVVMLAPTAEPGMSPFGRSSAQELSDQHFHRSLGIFADDASIAAFGRNPLDPACRPAAASAGREQGRCQAAALSAFLNNPSQLRPRVARWKDDEGPDQMPYRLWRTRGGYAGH